MAITSLLHFQYLRSRLSHQETFSVRGTAAFNSARLVIASTIARRYSADDRTSLIGLLSWAATAATCAARSSVRNWPSSNASALRARIGVGATAPRTIRDRKSVGEGEGVERG